MKTGDLVADRYIVRRQIGEDTFIAENLASGILWTLKALDSLERRNILPFLQQVRHPALPRIFETFEIEGKAFYLLEYIEGSTLLELCENHGGRLPYLEACEYMAKVARTLYFLHHQNANALLHLDIKPRNIVISKSNQPCLIDYGSLQIRHETDGGEIKDAESRIFGTPGYAPPEMLQGKTPVEQSDVYMVGMTLLRLITGQEPSISAQQEPRHWLSVMPAAVAKTIRKCIMNKPEDRYGNASELALDLESACSLELRYETYPEQEFAEPVTVREPSPPTGYDAAKSRNRKHAEKSSGKRAPSRNRILCVWNHVAFAVDLSAVLAKQGKSVLLIDADLLAPGVDLLLELKTAAGKTEKDRFGNNPLADLMEESAKRKMTLETIRMIARPASIEGLFCICGDYRMEDYEYYSTDGLVDVIRTACAGFDYVVVSCGKFIYDEFTCAAQICADRIFVPVAANHLQFREFNRYIHFLNGRKQLEREKIAFVAYDYMPNEDLSYGTCDELCGGLFFGTVSFSQKRRMMQGSKKPYANVMESKIEKQYLGILKKTAIFAH